MCKKKVLINFLESHLKKETIINTIRKGVCLVLEKQEPREESVKLS